MAEVRFIADDGSETVLDVQPGNTLMMAAVFDGITAIEGVCGGCLSCATCHVYVDEPWREKTGKPSDMEEDMLDFAFDVREESRLSCQIRVTADIDGLVVRVPAKQF
ncbi:MAG TPA: 2Fe-2S iron-sulfur cluster-binding protein [Burkholderiaceae bacterium]|mgnify:CR=1 FL=1|nr:2Fe-2S iron-sulfur cluster-binding protein [Burkholderiaceae bacterium]